MDRRLLRRFLEVYPFQPATAVWRASEVAALKNVSFPPGRGLDLGCGDGRLTRVLSEEVGPLHLVGIDVDPMETGLAESEGFYEAVHTSSADRIPEPDGSFDFVVSISVMEHIGPIEAVLREVTRLLKPRGRLITTVPAVGFHRVLRGLFASSRDAYLSGVDRRLAHLRYWTTDEWRQALDAAGMRLIEARVFLSRGETRRWETISRFTAGMLHAMARGKPPIEIQRSLGLRRKGQRLPGPVAAVLSHLLAVGLTDAQPVDETDAGCLLVIAERP